MAFYLGSSNNLKICLNGVEYCFGQYLEAPIVNRDVLLSLDGYILRDSNGLYLIANNNVLLSLDGHMLKDSNELYLTAKEIE